MELLYSTVESVFNIFLNCLLNLMGKQVIYQRTISGIILITVVELIGTGDLFLTRSYLYPCCCNFCPPYNHKVELRSTDRNF